MPRKPRVHFPGATYHVICRGNNRAPVFDRESDRRSYLALLRDYKRKYEFKLYAWAVLSNHAHMLIVVSDTPLSKIMQGVQQMYTGRYNHFNKRTGHVFEQRYRAFLCHSDEQVLATIHYIHHNPARAGLPGGIDNPFCSHQAYLRGVSDSLTDVEAPLNLLASDRAVQRQRYLEFIMSKGSGGGGVYHVMNRGQICQSELAGTQRGAVKASLPELVEICAHVCGIESMLLSGGGRHLGLSEARRALVQFCLKHTYFSRRELALHLGISQAAVSQASAFVSDRSESAVRDMLAQLK